MKQRIRAILDQMTPVKPRTKRAPAGVLSNWKREIIAGQNIDHATCAAFKAQDLPEKILRIDDTVRSWRAARRFVKLNRMPPNGWFHYQP